jgi:hypothetical protein
MCFCMCLTRNNVMLFSVRIVDLDERAAIVGTSCNNSQFLFARVHRFF